MSKPYLLLPLPSLLLELLLGFLRSYVSSYRQIEQIQSSFPMSAFTDLPCEQGGITYRLMTAADTDSVTKVVVKAFDEGMIWALSIRR